MKFGQVIEYNKRYIFLKKIMQKMRQAENEAGRLVSDLFCFKESFI